MDGESLRYDAALAAGLLIYEGLVPEPGKPDALILGQIVFIIVEAMDELERRQGRIDMPQNRLHTDDGVKPEERPSCRKAVSEWDQLHTDDGVKPEERRPEEFLFFCAKCLGQFKVKAAHKDKRCLCPGCGAAMRTPDVTRN